MDFTVIQNWVSTAIPGPWGILAGIGAVVFIQYLKVRFPDALRKLPNIVPLPVATPALSQPATPEVPAPNSASPTNHPAINALLALLGSQAIPVLIYGVKRMIGDPDRRRR